MKECHQFYINGEWVDSLSSELIEVENPATEQVIGTIASGTKEDVNHAVSCLLYTSPSLRDRTRSRMPSSA